MRRKIPVSVVIPAYNSEKFMDAVIKTVHSQSVCVEEIIVVDDESGDRTAAEAERLGARVLREPHGGQSAARNAGIRAARGEWIATLDADDVWHPRKLELQYDAIVADPELGLVFSDFDAVSASDGNIEKPNVIADDSSFQQLKFKRLTSHARRFDFSDFLRGLAARSMILPSTAVFRRDLALSVGGFSLHVKAEDADFFLRIASRTITGFVDVPLVAYMKHASSITANWDLDFAKLALYHQVMAHKNDYDESVVRGLRDEYPKLLYASAANAAKHKQVARSAGLLLKAVAVAASQGQLATLFSTVAKGKSLRKSFGQATPPPVVQSPATIVSDIEIPWRCDYAALSGT